MTKYARPLVTATLEVYETIQKHLLPTPTKIHYTFNLRDVSKVIQVRLVSPESLLSLAACFRSNKCGRLINEQVCCCCTGSVRCRA